MGRTKEIGPFRFKKFECCHSRSSMRIGVDGVLVGAWGSVGDMLDFDEISDTAIPAKILDAGCGCGVIALMAAQRNPIACVDAIDIDGASVEEASENFRNSPWSNRLNASLETFGDYCSNHHGSLDAIMSNPPYFDDGVCVEEEEDDEQRRRLRARHRGGLSPEALIVGAGTILKPGGTLAFIIPVEDISGLNSLATKCGLMLTRRCEVFGHAAVQAKRLLLEYRKAEKDIFVSGEDVVEEKLILERVPGEATPEYRKLCHDFYLRF